MHLLGILHLETPLNFSHLTKSAFIPVRSFQLESIFSSVVHDLLQEKYEAPRKKNLNKKEYQALKD